MLCQHPLPRPGEVLCNPRVGTSRTYLGNQANLGYHRMRSVPTLVMSVPYKASVVQPPEQELIDSQLGPAEASSYQWASEALPSLS